VLATRIQISQSFPTHLVIILSMGVHYSRMNNLPGYDIPESALSVRSIELRIYPTLWYGILHNALSGGGLLV
jgi:hypothetical protein